MPEALTAKQRAVLEFIRACQARDGAPPQLAEIARQFKISPPAAHKHVDALKRKGHLFQFHHLKRDLKTLTRTPSELALEPFHIPMAAMVDANGEVAFTTFDRPLELPFLLNRQPGTPEHIAGGVMDDLPELVMRKLDLLIVSLRPGNLMEQDLVLLRWPEIGGAILARYIGATTEGLPLKPGFIDPVPLWEASEYLQSPEGRFVFTPFSKQTEARRRFQAFAQGVRARKEKTVEIVGPVRFLLRLTAGLLGAGLDDSAEALSVGVVRHMS